MKNLILTLDYELWGDGSGNVFRQIIEPTNRILNICNENNIKITIFFEAIEYLKLKKEWEKGNSMWYNKNPVKAIEEQIQNAVLEGHDVQLHIHPQWANAKYVNEKWEIDNSNWCLGEFNIESDYRIETLIKDGKDAFESIIKPVKPEYKCIGFRAGGFNIIPSSDIYDAMLNLGLKVDSSVYPGGFENNYTSRYDYRHVPLDIDYWWGSLNDITKQENEKKEIIEIPIFSLMQPRWKKVFNFQKIKALLGKNKSKVSIGAKEKFSNKTFFHKTKFLFEKEAFTWDFCLFNNSQHKKYFDFIEQNLLNKRKYFVLIGHSKSLTSDNSFRSFLKLVQERKHPYTFKTLSEIYEEIRN